MQGGGGGNSFLSHRNASDCGQRTEEKGMGDVGSERKDKGIKRFLFPFTYSLVACHGGYETLIKLFGRRIFGDKFTYHAVEVHSRYPFHMIS